MKEVKESLQNFNKTYRLANFKILLLSMFVMFVMLMILIYFVEKVSYTVNQTYYLIFGMSILTILMVIVNLKFSKIIRIFIFNDKIEIMKSNNSIIFNKKNIHNYNFYLLTNKVMGHLLRIKYNNKEYIYWIVWKDINKFDNTELAEINALKTELALFFKDKLRKTSKDYFIQFLTYLPFILLVFGIAIFIGGLIYTLSK